MKIGDIEVPQAKQRVAKYTTLCSVLKRVCHAVLAVTPKTKVVASKGYGLMIKSTDKYGYLAVKVVCSGLLFNEEFFEFSDDISFVVDWEKLKNVLEYFKKDEGLVVEISETDDKNSYCIKVSGDWYSAEIVTEELCDVRWKFFSGKLDGMETFEVDAKQIHTFCKKSCEFENITLSLKNGWFSATIISESQGGAKYKYERSGHVIHQKRGVKSKFSVRFIQDAFRSLKGYVEVSLGNDCPVMLHSAIAETIDIKYVIAPIVSGR